MIINEELKPVRSLNLTQTISIIISTVIGSGVFISLPIIAQIAGSPLLATIIWLLGGLMWLPPILILAEMGTAYPDQGFGYYYLQKAGSPFLAFIYTWTCFFNKRYTYINNCCVKCRFCIKNICADIR